MESDLLKFVAIGFGVLIFYALLARGLFNATEPLRNSLLDLGANLINSEQVSPAKKLAICRRLDEVHSAKRAWKLVFYALCAAVTKSLTNDDEARETKGIPSHLVGDFNKFGIYWVIATVANSPLASLLALLIVIFRATMDASVTAYMKTIGTIHDTHYRENSIAH